MNDIDRTFNNQFSSVDFGLGLLDLEQTLGHLDMIRELHELHSGDIDTGVMTSDLKNFSELDANELGIREERDFIWVGMSIRELSTHVSHNFLSLVVNKLRKVRNGKSALDGVGDYIIDNGRHIHWRSIQVRYRRSLHL